MIDNHLLEELVTFSQTGTLAQTAQKFHLTQPTITRGLQKLETELGVQLFIRQPNRLSLTSTGRYAAQEAQKLLQQNKSFHKNVRNYEISHRQIKIGSVAPGPVIILKYLRTHLNRPFIIEDQLLRPENILPQLQTNYLSIIITNQPLNTEMTTAKYLMQERLAVNLDKFMDLASQKTVTFNQLKGKSFIVLQNIGIWKNIIQEQVPAAKFLYQEQQEALAEITKYSNFPYFSTNFTPFTQHFPPNNGRNCVPIADQSAQMDFYAVYLTKNAHQLTPFINSLATACHQLIPNQPN
ncbi:LysR family transcriptional regulator [Bombilactobacillus bombi]|uniref:LysR family transcriptional regulator n=1 Tax=Bombilactobacillus bombi TaxID=1303590 RepID=UPI0015E62770|nr:LysR family transcriptional regulator [Bombilactobacillus bombi]MBA1435050.1 LysR family transcriptional regulator [Bombilactobacillus bombi]